MRKFSYKSECLKCGSQMYSIHYEEAHHEYRAFGGELIEATPERIAVICDRCGYTQYTKTKDAT